MIENKTILIVEDSTYQRKIIGEQLNSIGVPYLQATNGMDALEVINANHVDLILTDLLMPKMGGVEFIKKLKELNKNIPIIVITADIQNEVKKECADLGVSYYLPKPINTDKLLELMRLLLPTKQVTTVVTLFL